MLPRPLPRHFGGEYDFLGPFLADRSTLPSPRAANFLPLASRESLTVRRDVTPAPAAGPAVTHANAIVCFSRIDGAHREHGAAQRSATRSAAYRSRSRGAGGGEGGRARSGPRSFLCPHFSILLHLFVSFSSILLRKCHRARGSPWCFSRGSFSVSPNLSRGRFFFKDSFRAARLSRTYTPVRPNASRRIF